MKSLLRLSIIFILLAGGTKAQNDTMPLFHQKTNLHTKQLLVVVTDDWSSLQGTIYAFQLTKGKWVQQFTNAIVVGSNGLGTGDGLVQVTIDSAPVKKEGDLKAPAGIFTIGTAFGYADAKNAKWIKNPYIKTADTVICVDDIHSAFYNTLLKTDSVKSDWNSFEYMHRKDDYYKWGLFINHNAGKPVPAKGSCIFMHIWENGHTGTEGCTAMQENNLLRILHWINVKYAPLLIQLPKAEYTKLTIEYNIPAISFN